MTSRGPPPGPKVAQLVCVHMLLGYDASSFDSRLSIDPNGLVTSRMGKIATVPLYRAYRLCTSRRVSPPVGPHGPGRSEFLGLIRSSRSTFSLTRARMHGAPVYGDNCTEWSASLRLWTLDARSVAAAILAGAITSHPAQAPSPSGARSVPTYIGMPDRSQTITGEKDRQPGLAGAVGVHVSLDYDVLATRAVTAGMTHGVSDRTLSMCPTTSLNSRCGWVDIRETVVYHWRHVNVQRCRTQLNGRDVTKKTADANKRPEFIWAWFACSCSRGTITCMQPLAAPVRRGRLVVEGATGDDARGVEAIGAVRIVDYGVGAWTPARDVMRQERCVRQRCAWHRSKEYLHGYTEETDSCPGSG